MDHGGGCQGRLHRPRQPLGERLHRELQRPAPRRAARWRDLLQLARGPGRDRELETALQPGAPACLARLPGTGTGGGPCATPASLTNHPGRGPTTSHALTFNPDHPAGAGHWPANSLNPVIASRSSTPILTGLSPDGPSVRANRKTWPSSKTSPKKRSSRPSTG